MKGILLLEDGRQFIGEGFGAGRTVAAEVVFNTGMTGYQEIITDPSYKGQMVTMTYPHIGNTGINTEDGESDKPCVAGLIVREVCTFPSNYRSKESLDNYLKRHDIPGLQGIDTRALTRHIRESGAMMGVLSTESLDKKMLVRTLETHPPIGERDLVSEVTSSKSRKWHESVQEAWYYNRPQIGGKKLLKVAAFNLGIKSNILRLLKTFNTELVILPASTRAEEILEMRPDGVFLSNGPGDPQAIPYAVKEVKRLLGKVPIFGICLGHQILGLAAGANTYKLKFGHHGCNHPVKHLESGTIAITSQNHNYAVDAESIKACGFEMTHINLNDQTVEGMRHTEMPIYSLQYHPESAPGPHDALESFSSFIEMMMQ